MKTKKIMSAESSIFSTILADIEEKPTILQKNKNLSDESSIFSTTLADIEENPTILQKNMNLSDKYSIFSTFFADVDEENPTILQKKKLSDEYSIFSTILADVDKENPTILQKDKKTPIDFTCTVQQTLTRSDLIHLLKQELAIQKSEMETVKGETTSDRFVSPNPNYDRECVCVEEEGKVEQREEEEEVKYFADEVLEWLFKGDEISTDTTEDSVCKPKPVDDESLNSFDEGIDKCVEEIVEKIEKDASYFKRVKEDYIFGDFLQELVMKRLAEKAEKEEKEEKEISSWISNGEEEPEETETQVAEQEKRRDTKKKKQSPVKRIEQESAVTNKHDYSGYKRRLYLIEKLREIHEKLRERRRKAVRYGVEFSFLVAEYTFLTSDDLLASEIEDFVICLKRLGVNEDDKGTSVIIGKLKEVLEIVRMRMNKEITEDHHNMKNFPESVFRFDDYVFLCVDAIQILGKIVCGLIKNNDRDERVKLSDLDSWFEDCRKVLMKIELKLGEMKQCVYRSVSVDYESFSKSERIQTLNGKLMNRINANNGFGRSVIRSHLVEIWKSLFQQRYYRRSRDKNE